MNEPRVPIVRVGVDLAKQVIQVHAVDASGRRRETWLSAASRADAEALLREAGIADAKLVEATEADWREEYLAPIIAVKVVAGLDEAIEHINTCSSGHTEAIVTENYSHAMRFLREVDSSSVMVNASTRFADGFEYGLGAEIGISTDKIHARGPVGLEGLTSQKWIVFGNGEIRR